MRSRRSPCGHEPPGGPVARAELDPLGHRHQPRAGRLGACSSSRWNRTARLLGFGRPRPGRAAIPVWAASARARLALRSTSRSATGCSRSSCSASRCLQARWRSRRSIDTGAMDVEPPRHRRRRAARRIHDVVAVLRATDRRPAHEHRSQLRMGLRSLLPVGCGRGRRGWLRDRGRRGDAPRGGRHRAGRLLARIDPRSTCSGRGSSTTYRGRCRDGGWRSARSRPSSCCSPPSRRHQPSPSGSILTGLLAARIVTLPGKMPPPRPTLTRPTERSRRSPTATGPVDAAESPEVVVARRDGRAVLDR